MMGYYINVILSLKKKPHLKLLKHRSLNMLLAGKLLDLNESHESRQISLLEENLLLTSLMWKKGA